MLIDELVRRNAGAASHMEQEGTQVFEATAVYDSLPSSQAARIRALDGLTVRPPYDCVWLEYRDASGGMHGLWHHLISRREPTAERTALLRVMDSTSDPAITLMQDSLLRYVGTDLHLSGLMRTDLSRVVRAAFDAVGPSVHAISVTQISHAWEAIHICGYAVAFLDDDLRILRFIPDHGFGWQAPDGEMVDVLGHDVPQETPVFFVPAYLPLPGTKTASYVPHLWEPWFVAMFTFGMLNCRNITTREHVPNERMQRARVRRGHLPFVTYKTLHIAPPGTKGGAQREREREPVRGIIPMHLCRGNFAHYSEDAPLFGKYSGTYWRPAHVKGNPERGAVVKDYQLDAAD